VQEAKYLTIHAAATTSSCLPVCLCHSILQGLPGCCPRASILVQVQPAFACIAKAATSTSVAQGQPPGLAAITAAMAAGASLAACAALIDNWLSVTARHASSPSALPQRPGFRGHQAQAGLQLGDAAAQCSCCCLSCFGCVSCTGSLCQLPLLSLVFGLDALQSGAHRLQP
jgi:hypothetical protein